MVQLCSVITFNIYTIFIVMTLFVLCKSTIDESTYAEKIEAQPVTPNIRIDDKTAIPK